jgi:hypothetical protein
VPIRTATFSSLQDSDIVSVDSCLGLVTLVAPEFDLERADVAANAALRPPGVDV